MTLDPRFAVDAYGYANQPVDFSTGFVRVRAEFETWSGRRRELWTYYDGVFTLELFPGLKFHNGRPVTPEDLLFTFEEFMSSKSPFASSLTEIEKVEATEAGDHQRVKITMKHFVADFLGADFATLKIIPRREIGGFPGT